MPYYRHRSAGSRAAARWRLRTVVFNNPFDSFHNTVAEAKEEREQLDRLLTISTPRERLLVAVIALALVILAAWLLFGSVSRSLAVDGVLVESGAEGNASVQALVWVRSDIAPQIEAGAPVLIELASGDGDAQTLDGEVAAIAAVPLADVPATLESSAPLSVLRVDIALDEDLDVGSLAARQCRIVIELGRQSPAALFGMRQS